MVSLTLRSLYPRERSSTNWIGGWVNDDTADDDDDDDDDDNNNYYNIL